jgi:hypothetical protein
METSWFSRKPTKLVQANFVSSLETNQLDFFKNFWENLKKWKSKKLNDKSEKPIDKSENQMINWKNQLAYRFHSKFKF